MKYRQAHAAAVEANGATGAFSREERERGTRLRGRRLLLVRVGWLVIVGVTLALYVLSISISIVQPKVICATPPCAPSQLTPNDVQRLQQQGLTIELVSTYYIATDVLFEVVFVAVALVIFWRKSNDWMAILVALMLVTFSIATFSNSLDTVSAAYPALNPVSGVISLVGAFSLFLSFFLFPDGRFVPRWTVLLFLLTMGFGLVSAIFPDSPLGDNGLGLFAGLGSILFVQIYRYRRVSDTVGRQQTKWVVLGATAGFIGFAALVLFLNILGVNPEGSRSPNVLVSMAVNAAFRISLSLIPLSLMVAILRYRLWEIDVLINRTLVYVPLTAILAGIFAASITLSQKLFIALTGEKSDAATVLTTLIVVAVIEPLKTGLQHIVDRRLKDGADPVKEWKAYGDELKTFVQIMDADASLRRLLEEAVHAFGATGGEVELQKDGHLQVVGVTGEWDGHARLTVPLVAPKGNVRIGKLGLGARRDGREYGEKDRASLNATAGLVAQAVALTDRSNGEKS